MKCKDCSAAVKGFFACEPDKHVCIGVKEPFVIHDINKECTEYPEEKPIDLVKFYRINGKDYGPYVGYDGIYIPNVHNDTVYYQRIMTKDMFVTAYNKWIKHDDYDPFVGQDTADDWCE